MSGTIVIKHISKTNELTTENFDIKMAPHICSSYDFLYEDGDVKSLFNEYRLCEKQLNTRYDTPTQEIIINHNEKTLTSNQTYFDIKEYALFLMELICADIVDKNDNFVPNILGELILKNILKMVNKRKFTAFKVVRPDKTKEIPGKINIHYLYENIEIPDREWDKESWRKFVLSKINNPLDLGRNYWFEIPETVKIIQLDDE